MHLTFGVYSACGTHFVDSVAETLPEDPFLRADIPPVDDGEAFDAYLDQVADRVRDALRKSESKERMRREMMNGAYGDLTTVNFPAESRTPCFRLRSVRSRLSQSDGATRLATPSGETTLADGDVEITAWLLKVDFTDFSELQSAFPNRDTVGLAETMARLAEAGLVDPV